MKAWKISTRLQWIIGLLGALLVGIGALGLQGLFAMNQGNSHAGDVFTQQYPSTRV